jgi:hypothetical protein
MASTNSSHNANELAHKRKVKAASGIRRGNHNQTLARVSKTATTKDLKNDLSHSLVLIEMAGRPTEKLDLPVALRLRDILDLVVVSDDQSGPDGLLKEEENSKTDDHLKDEAERLFNPPDNDLKNVIHCIMRFGSDLFTGQDIRWELAAPPDLDQIHLKTEQCRQLYLIFKEALQNIARHAGCSAVSLSVSIRGQWLEVKIHDNGSGLIGKLMCQSTIRRRSGGELRNIQTRAAELGGALEIASAYEWGTRLTLTLPLDQE